MADRLTNEQLANFEASFREDAKHGERLSIVAADDIAEVVAELRELRALLETPLTCGLEAPRVDRGVTPPLVIEGELGDETTREADDAIAYGAAWMRAGIEARGGK